MDDSATTPERWEQIQQLFHEALTADDRAAFLAEACGSDTDLRSRVESLVAAVADDDRFMEESHGAVLVEAFGDDGDAAPAAGRTIGGFRIVREIGSGGMGSVYEAVQEHPHRTVALKLMRGGVPSRAALRRFTYESEILGRLRHPAVAHVYESGTHDDGSGAVPWFAMEFVPEARSIVQYALDEALDVRARLRLVADVCDAVQHGHQMGVIHRDLKPANILVDGEGRPKVIDFGVARVLDSENPVTSIATGVGQLVGTLQYMSPEQCSGDPRDVDARCDVYALGIVLYELLAGQAPYDLDSRSVPDSIRVIGESSPRRLSSVDRVFRGDLETIVSKTLEKDPARRYQSASELSADIHRYLGDEPIVARPASAFYQMRKFASRNRALVGGIVGVFVVFAIGFVVSTVLFLQADSARQAEAVQKQIATKQAAEAEAARDDAEFRAYVANIAAANASIRACDVVDARRRLDQAPPDRRAWEWHHFHGRLDRSAVVIDTGQSTLRSVAFDADGTRLALAGGDGRVRLVDTTSWQVSTTTARHRDVAGGGLAFTPDGRFLASSSLAVKLWAVSTGEQVGADLALHDAHVHGVAFTPDGTRLVTGSKDATVRLWDVESGRAVHADTGHGDRVHAVRVSPDGRTIATASWDGLVRFIDVETWTVTRTLEHPDRVYDVAFSPDGTLIASAGADAAVRVWHAASGAEQRMLTGHTGTVHSLEFSPDGARIASASGDTTIRLWDVRSGRSLGVLLGHGRAVMDVVWSPDGRVVASASQDGTARIWPVDADDVPVIHRHDGWVYGLAVSPDGTLLASAGQRAEDHEIWLWNAADFAPVGRLGGATATVWALAFDPSGSRVASASTDGTLRIHTVGSEEPPLVVEAHGRAVFGLDWSPDGTVIATGSRDGTVRLGDVRTGDERARFDAGRGSVWSVQYSPDGAVVAAGCNDGLVRTWDPGTGAPSTPLEGDGSAVRAVAFSPDGRHLVAGTHDGTLIVWDARTRRRLATPRHHGGRTQALAFHPDQSRLATGATDYTIKIWDTTSWQEVATLHGHRMAVWSLLFTPDGRHLVSGSGDRTIRLWDS